MLYTTESPVFGFFFERGNPRRGDYQRLFWALETIEPDPKAREKLLKKVYKEAKTKDPAVCLRHLEVNYGHQRNYLH